MTHYELKPLEALARSGFAKRERVQQAAEEIGFYGVGS